MSVPRAYLLTWTCYGTWLHGDERGSVDAGHNVYKRPCVSPSPTRQIHAVMKQTGAAERLGERARRIVHDTIVAHCAHRGWDLLALNVRSNHVHVVVMCGEDPPERAMAQFKAWSTRRLRENDLAASDASIWTEHGSTRYLWDEGKLQRAVNYVTDHQGEDLEGDGSMPSKS
ncbi:MAG: transposase [Planctomycetota bacterium]